MTDNVEFLLRAERLIVELETFNHELNKKIDFYIHISDRVDLEHVSKGVAGGVRALRELLDKRRRLHKTLTKV